MPCYDFACTRCATVSENVVVTSSDQTVVCFVCGAPMERLFPTSFHTKIGVGLDGRNRGKVVQEKNERLKKMHAGYSGEEQNMRKEISEQIKKKVSQ